jgi:hypothetical protein
VMGVPGVVCKKRVSDSGYERQLTLSTFPLRKLLVRVSEMYVLFRVAVSEVRFISETAERFVLYESNPCSDGFTWLAARVSS